MSLYDGEGERLSTLRMARMPQEKKTTLKMMVAAEVEAVLGQRPDLRLVKIADGAKDNWTFLGEVLPAGVELIDFFHAAEHLKDGFDAAYGADDPKATAQFKKYRHLLRHDSGAVKKVSGPCAICARRIPTTNGARKRSATSATINTA